MSCNLVGWDEDKFLDVVNMLLNADEVERALLFLDNVPAYFRDQPTERMKKMRGKILGAMVTAHAYMSSGLDANVVENPEHNKYLIDNLLRGQLVKHEVERYNKNGVSPQIIDVGPGEYFIPLGLSAYDFGHWYFDVAMDQNTQAATRSLINRGKSSKTETPHIFVALEIIEHLADPRELAVEALRHCGKWPERVHLSTPLYCFDGKVKDWQKPCGLPHLRAYTPNEFINEAMRIFPNYKWEFFGSQPMSLRGQRSDTIDPEPLPVGGS